MVLLFHWVLDGVTQEAAPPVIELERRSKKASLTTPRPWCCQLWYLSSPSCGFYSPWYFLLQDLSTRPLSSRIDWTSFMAGDLFSKRKEAKLPPHFKG